MEACRIWSSFHEPAPGISRSITYSGICATYHTEGAMAMFDRHTTMAKLGPAFAAAAAAHDADDRFVRENYTALKEYRAFSAMVPEELGGGSLPHSEMCHFIREMAQCCSSTALAFAMHQHIVAAAVFNYRRGNPGEKLLRRVAEGELVLVSTGATDWLKSSGVLTLCEGGFR